MFYEAATLESANHHIHMMINQMLTSNCTRVLHAYMQPAATNAMPHLKRVTYHFSWYNYP